MIKKTKKEYYSLIELESMVDIKKRALKYRMLKVKEKYKDNKKLLYKSNKNWNIHYSIIFEFDKVRLTKSEKILQYNSLITISPYGNYDLNALIAVVNQIFNDLKKVKSDVCLHYFIEQGERGSWNHIHFITNLSNNHEKMIIRISNRLIICNTDVSCIYEKWRLLKYLRKEIKAQGELPGVQ